MKPSRTELILTCLKYLMEQHQPLEPLNESTNDRVYRKRYHRLMENLTAAINEEISNQ